MVILSEPSPVLTPFNITFCPDISASTVMNPGYAYVVPVVIQPYCATKAVVPLCVTCTSNWLPSFSIGDQTAMEYLDPLYSVLSKVSMVLNASASGGSDRATLYMLHTVVPVVSVLAAHNFTTPSLSMVVVNSRQLDALDET